MGGWLVAWPLDVVKSQMQGVRKVPGFCLRRFTVHENQTKNGWFGDSFWESKKKEEESRTTPFFKLLTHFLYPHKVDEIGTLFIKK